MIRDDDFVAAQQVKAGDIEAFAGIVTRNQGRLMEFGRRFFRSRVDIEDFAQETFLQAFRKIHTYRSESRFSSWLLGIAYRLAIRQKNRTPSHDCLDTIEVRDERVTPERELIASEARRAVVDAIQSLPERFAMCIDLFFFFGMTYADISATTGFPVNTVRSHIRRAKLLLRNAILDNTSEGYRGVS